MCICMSSGRQISLEKKEGRRRFIKSASVSDWSLQIGVKITNLRMMVHRNLEGGAVVVVGKKAGTDLVASAVEECVGRLGGA